VSRKHHIPAGIPADDLGQHLLVALVRGVADPYTEFSLKAGNGLRCNVCRPVVHIESRARIARAASESGEPRDEIAALHVSRTLSEISISTPNTKVISAEIALITGLAPRRAIA